MPLNFGQSLFGRTIIDDTGTELSDWKAIIDSGTRITKSAGANNATVTIYTVPTGKKFYMIAAILFVNPEGSAGTGRMFVGTDGTDNRIISLTIDSTSNPVLSESIAFTIPLIFSAGDAIKIVSGISLDTNGTVIGYEV